LHKNLLQYVYIEDIIIFAAVIVSVVVDTLFLCAAELVVRDCCSVSKYSDFRLSSNTRQEYVH